MPDAAPVNSGGDEPVEEGVRAPEAVVLRDSGTDKLLLGWRMVELETGYPVLAAAEVTGV
jgi:hypothetical protein